MREVLGLGKLCFALRFLAIVFVQNDLAESNGLRSDFDVFVFLNVFQGLFHIGRRDAHLASVPIALAEQFELFELL